MTPFGANKGFGGPRVVPCSCGGVSSRNKTRVIRIVVIYFRSTAVKIKYDLICYMRREVYNAITRYYIPEELEVCCRVTYYNRSRDCSGVQNSSFMILTVDVYLGGLGVPPIMCPSKM